MPVQTANEVATIPINTALSGVVHLHGHRLFALQMPAAWDAADLTLQGSFDGVTYANVYDETGTEVTIDAAASRYILIDPAKYLGLQKLVIRSGTSSAPVNQTAARAIQVITVG